MADGLAEALGMLFAVGTLPTGILAALFVGWEASAVVFVVGWFLLVPASVIVGQELAPELRARFGDRKSSVPSTDPLAELKARYARGEIDDEEFERRVEMLIETENIEVGRDVDVERVRE